MKKLYVLTCSVTAILALALVAPLALRLFTGGFYMTVQGESMTPTYHLGDVLLVRPTPPSKVHIGDIVIARFAGTTGHDSLYVHRVISHESNSWVLRGDHNKQSDPVPITDKQIAGTPTLALTHGVGEAFTFTQNVFGRIFLAIVMILLVSWPAIVRWWRSEPEPEVVATRPTSDDLP